MKINLLAGGPVRYLPDLLPYDGKWIGVDRGVWTLLELGLKVETGLGDFDSVTEHERRALGELVQELHTFPPEKDETDMELALRYALKQKPAVIRLFGATGGRLDHFFANIQLLLSPDVLAACTTVEIIDHQNSVTVKRPGEHKIEYDPSYRYVSFIPLQGEVKSLTLEGFKYPLDQETIPVHSTRCISNELLSERGTIFFTSGILMVIRSRDELPAK